MSINFFDYDYILVMFSGGKDSIASLFSLIEAGAPVRKIELWHHLVDGDKDLFFDWPCTESYCRAFAQAFALPLRLSWKEGGFRQEMLRENQRTQPITFETPAGFTTSGGDRGKESTRHKFPQVTADLSRRWCSAYLKIDVGTTAIRNDPRFIGKRTLVISGERAEESAARAKYKVFEPDRADNRGGERVDRHVDRYRPIHNLRREEVWAICKRWQVNAHPAYHLGWGRLSCMDCIFALDEQLASVYYLDPGRLEGKAGYEQMFGCTISRDKRSVIERARAGTPYAALKAPGAGMHITQALSTNYCAPLIVNPWPEPAGMHTSEGGGPT